MARDNKKTCIVPCHIQLVVCNDEELTKLLGGATIMSGDVMPNIHQHLLPQKAASSKVANVNDDDTFCHRWIRLSCC